MKKDSLTLSASPRRFKEALAQIPLPGQRIMRSILSVWLCMVVYYARGQYGEPFYSIMAALQCIQPYSSNMLEEGRKRITGTMIGAVWGSVVLFAELLPSVNTVRSTIVFYALLGLFAGVVIYSTVLFGIQQYALFSTVVFLGIAMFHAEDANPYIHVFNRTMDTIIGVGIAIVVNSLHFPRTRDTSTLFVSGIDHTLYREDRRLAPYTAVELNRFLDDGMLFTVSTRQTPATVREILADVNLRLPIIAMDGAVLYDVRTMKYVKTIKMDPDLVTLVSDFLHEQGMPFFVNTVQDDLLVIYFRDYRDLLLEEVMDVHRKETLPADEQDFDLSKSAYLAMARLYHRKRSSPYRNYVRTNARITKDVLYLQVVDRGENIDRLREVLIQQPWAGRCRTNFETYDCEEGEKIMRIYAAEANRPAMVEVLRKRVGVDKILTFTADDEDGDVIIKDASRGRMVKELRKRFEPVSIKGWRNIIHL